MKKLLFPVMFVLPAALLACGGDDVEELVDESAALALSSDDPDADTNTEDALGANDMDTNEAAEDQADAAIDGEPQEAIFSCDFIALRQQIKARFDVNNDGKLDREERAELQAQLDDHPRVRFARKILLGKPGRKPHFGVWKRIKWAFDADNDGTLNEEERAALIEASQQRCERRRANFVERFDTDNDGELTQDELRAGLTEVKARWQERRTEFLAQWDTNGDGQLDDAERAELREHIRSRKEEIRTHVKEVYDVNGNGMLDADELAALKAEIRRRYVEGFRSQEA
jgi:Ca2+-binding EF-hand superfamily protein